MSQITIAVLTDLHYGESSALAERRAAIADILCVRAVNRLNTMVRPDITVVLGDVLDDGQGPDARKRLLRMRSIFDGLDSPLLVLPGNHDGDPETFYEVFERPKQIEEIAGVRFLPFLDREEPGYNASRTDKDIQRFRQARSGFDGPIVALQHVCLFPPGTADAPYNYTNADRIIDAMGQAGRVLSLSGHHHPGVANIRRGDITFAHAPGLCESPFPFAVVRVNDGGIESERHELAMPRGLRLFDSHVHTELAYCGDDVSAGQAAALADDFGLDGIGFAEHSGQLYYPAEEYWSGDCLREGIADIAPPESRFPAYLEFRGLGDNASVRLGVEADCDFRGNLLLRPEDRRSVDFIIGAIHSTPSAKLTGVTADIVRDEFSSLLERFLRQEIDVLAHPFRLFRRLGLPVPEQLFAPTAKLLRDSRTAAEINFHTNEPPVEFVRCCLETGTKLSLGSDSHALYEVGEFAPHLRLLKEAGFDGDLSDILVRPGDPD